MFKVSKLPTYFLFVFPFLIFGVVYNIVSVGVLSVILLFYFTLFLNRHEKAVICGFILMTVLGFFCRFYNIPIPGSIVALLLMLVFLGNDTVIFLSSRYFVPYFFILCFFGICLMAYLLTGDTKNSTEKIFNMSIHMISAMISFSILKEFEDIRLERIAPMFLLESLILISMIMSSFFSHFFTGLFDFDAVRNTWIDLKSMGILYLNYHFMGIAAFLAAVFYLSEKKKLTTIFDYVFIISCVWAQFLAGARQGVLGFLFFFVFWLIYRQQRIRMSMLIISVLVLICAFYCLRFVDSETFGLIFEQSDHLGANMNRNYDYPLKIIDENFWKGIGFGNYHNPSTNEVYPHNMILELLCEWGIIGTFILFLPVVVYIASDNFLLHSLLGNSSLCMFVLFPYFTRAMISDDLSGNIELFCGFFILFYSKNQLKNPRN